MKIQKMKWFFFIAIEIDATEKGDDSAWSLPTVLGYDWTNFDVGEFVSSFSMGGELGWLTQ